MRKMKHSVKSLTAMFLSICLLLPQGAVNVWAAEEVPEASTGAAEEVLPEEAAPEASSAIEGTGIATASDAGKATENAGASSAKEKATGSDAMVDEDGHLIDGAVADDVTAVPEGEVIEAPEMKTEVIDPELAADEWLDDFDYHLSGGRIILTDYTGSDTIVFIHETAEYNGRTYPVAVGEGLFNANTVVDQIYFDPNVKFPANCSDMFTNCFNLQTVDMTDCDLSDVYSMGCMFYNCTNLYEVYFGNPDTSKLTDMALMFSGCRNLPSVNLTGLDMSGVTNMESMFFGCEVLEDVTVPEGFMSGVETVSNMFSGCSMMTYFNLADCDLSSVSDMSGMFQYCSGLKWMSLEGLNTSRVRYMDSTFDGCTSLEELDMTGVDLSSVTSADGMLNGCESLNSVYVPEGLAVDVELPRTMYTSAGVSYDSIPLNVNDSFHIADTQTYVMVTGIKINTEHRTVKSGEYFQLAAWPQPVNATNREVIWTSENPSVVFVDSLGLVYTSGESGTVLIQATTKDGGYTADCYITIGVPVTSVKINTTERTIAKGKTFQMAAWPQPVNAANKEVTWSSSNPAVATVDSTGLVTGIREGTANITVKTQDHGKTATCKITVGIPVTSLVINTAARTILAGKTFQMAAWPQPVNASNRAVTWSSSNPAVATVSSSGLVTGVKNGTAVITAKTVDGGFTKTCAITVGIPVTSVKINIKEKTMYVDRTFQLAAWPQPANASNKAVTWTSSNPSVAKVSSTGLVTAVKAGSAVITVKTADGGKTATCKITAAIPVNDVILNTTEAAIRMPREKTFQLKAWPQPVNATNRKVTWSSSRPDIATVDENGLVTAHFYGSTIITVTTEDGGHTATCRIRVPAPAG